ncbi:hypothetical protein ASU31_00760 [Pedobacter ginsenosidimutans]|uniref:Glycoside hydrolase n=1 Tax=Pedobacter ginsenosidimutans TaxID=687842 RepID=A0A0T5VVM0_9SPHI|nr:glycosyl hydrolase family 28 protein [Pedobacter ginsenosidimutans]KRT17856.1 hypothetical protein ASU31_00760 [Pedobacter ginsenosidimutans]
MKNSILLCLNIFFSLSLFAQKQFDILNFGAGIEKADNSKFIQNAIDNANAEGGGRVIIPAGNFITGPLILKSNVELHLESNSVLMGIAERMSYSDGKMAVVSSINQQNVSITGKGTIDGQAHKLMLSIFQRLRSGEISDDQWLVKRPTEANRTNILFFKGCQKVKVSGITLKDAASWVQNYKECNEVTIDSIKVHSTTYWNNDGIDIVDSKNVVISNSYFNAADDAICLKSETIKGICENIVVENCVLRSSASGFKIGTGSVGGFKNITVRNLVVFDTYRSAVAIEAVDGGFIDGVRVNNIKAKNTGNAIFVRLGHRNKDGAYSSVKNISFDNFNVEVPSGKPDIGYPLEGPLPKVPPHNLLPASITGLPGHLIENITLKNIVIEYGGGASKTKAFHSLDSLATVSENASAYPEFTMFGELPSWGMYIRHARRVNIINCKVSLKGEDFRPALLFDDVSKLDINNLSIPYNAPIPAIVYRNIKDLSVQEMDIPKVLNAIVTKE